MYGKFYIVKVLYKSIIIFLIRGSTTRNIYCTALVMLANTSFLALHFICIAIEP